MTVLLINRNAYGWCNSIKDLKPRLAYYRVLKTNLYLSQLDFIREVVLINKIMISYCSLVVLRRPLGSSFPCSRKKGLTSW